MSPGYCLRLVQHSGCLQTCRYFHANYRQLLQRANSQSKGKVFSATLYTSLQPVSHCNCQKPPTTFHQLVKEYTFCPSNRWLPEGSLTNLFSCGLTWPHSIIYSKWQMSSRVTWQNLNYVSIFPKMPTSTLVFQTLLCKHIQCLTTFQSVTGNWADNLKQCRSKSVMFLIN